MKKIKYFMLLVLALVSTAVLTPIFAMPTTQLGDWISTNHGHGSSSSNTWTFTVDEACYMYFEWSVSSESGCDVLRISLDGTEIVTGSGEQTSSFQGQLEAGEHTLISSYSKDGSVSHGSDQAMIMDLIVANEIDLSGISINSNDLAIRDDAGITFQSSGDYGWFQLASLKHFLNGNNGNPNSKSLFSMTYDSEYKTEFSFSWLYKNAGQHTLDLYIDGVKMSSASTSYYVNQRYFLEPGSHVILFNDSIGESSSTANNSHIKDIKLKEFRPLETCVLTEKSDPITFINSNVYPWSIEDGYIQNSNYGRPNTMSEFSTTFTVDRTSKLSYELAISSSSSDANMLNVYVNGILWDYWTAERDWTEDVIALDPGTYTIEWKDTLKNTSDYFYTKIRNIELSSDWINVDLATAGTLGYEVLYSGKANVLGDVEMLKIAGPMNASDWTDIMNMTNLLALDLSEAQITEIPNNAFDGKGRVNSVILPEGLLSIGEYAFRGTEIRKISIPSTVTNIKRNAFASTPLEDLTFADNSQISTIGYYAFQACSKLQSIDFGQNSQLEVISNYAFQNCAQLKNVNFHNMQGLKNIKYAAFADCPMLEEFIMPNCVTDLGFYQFHNNTSMKKLHLSDGLTYVPDFLCRNCTALTDVHLPVAATTIYRNAFESCTALRHIDIPETVNMIQFHTFYNCGLDSIVLPVKLTVLGHQCFQNSKNLKYAEMPSYVSTNSYSYRDSYGRNDGDSYYTYNATSNYDNTFQGCTSMETIVMRAATPPTVHIDIMNEGRAKSAITLVVPSFSVVNYKLDTYWYQFGTIVEGDDVDYWKLTSPLMLTNNRRMQGKPDVDLYYGGQLTVGGNAPFPIGQFNYYVNESNPGRLLNTCEAMTADAATTKFAVDANRWYFFTPLYNVALADIDVSNNASYVFRYYDAQNRAANGASGSWKNVDTDKLLGGQGYIFHCNTACTITFPADADGQKQLFNTKDVTRTLTVNEATSTANRSWNYVGNPYPAYYDIYYMDFTAPITVWNGSTYQAYSVADDEFVLRPMQSFFVQKPDEVDQIIFHKEGRQLTTSISHGVAAARAAQQSNRHIFNLGISANSEFADADMTRVVINSNASLGYEITCDAAKFMSFDANVPQLFTIDSEGNNYAINERPLSNGKVVLAYYAGQEGFYTIRSLRADGEVRLYDAVQNRTIDLTSEDYTFRSEATNGVNSSRFTLSFNVSDSETTGIEDVNRETITNNRYYDLQGRKTTAAQKGVFIQNGKKVVRQ